MPISSFSPTPVGAPNTPNPGEAPTNAPPVSNEANLHLNDIQQLLQAVDVAVQRGAYRASELSQLGAVYDKVHGFIKLVTEANQPQQLQAPQVPQHSMRQPEPVVPMTAPFAPRGA